MSECTAPKCHLTALFDPQLDETGGYAGPATHCYTHRDTTKPTRPPRAHNSRAHDAVNRDIADLTAIDLPALAQLLHTMIEHDEHNPSTPDGMPTQTIGASTNTNRHTIRYDPDGNPTPLPEPVHLTSVEAAREARTNHTRDEHRRLTRRACQQLNTATLELLATQRTLAQLQQLRTPPDNQPSTEPGCWYLERVGTWEYAAYRITDTDGHTHPASEWAYRIAKRLGREPNIDECTQRAKGRRVMVKQEAKAS